MNRLMRHKLKRMFDPSRAVYARSSLIVEGLTYADGEQIPWQELGVAQQDVEMWFRLRLISHFQEGDQSAEAQNHYKPEVSESAIVAEDPPKKGSRKKS